MHLLSDKLAGMIEAHTELITKRWLSEIGTDQTMSSYTSERLDYARERVANILFNLREWISYDTTKVDIGRRYAAEGIEYFKKGVPLCEAVLYQMSEIYERIIIFFDQAIYYISRGYTEEMSRKMKEL